MSVQFLGKEISGPFTIPSGIVATAVPIIEYVFRHIPQVGVMTTKSIGPEPRLGYREPILTQYAPGCFMNAVGLTNPGPEASARLFAELEVPEDRFFLVSIFGGSVAEFVAVAKLLAPYADGLELNLSCPHAQGYGMAMGQDPEMVHEITAAVKAAVDVPVVPKLTPNVEDIAAIAQAAVAAGADALCAINTVGPRLLHRARGAGTEQRSRRHVRQGRAADHFEMPARNSQRGRCAADWLWRREQRRRRCRSARCGSERLWCGLGLGGHDV